uniref:hypothetical protein n=1 Tax=uncultured Maribacter sp. TaxID=431308 RepID=UPI0026333E5F
FTDADTQLTDAQVATAVNNEFPNLDTDSTDDFDSEWSSLANVPAGFADDIDNDTQLTEAEVDAFVSNNGYLTSFSEVDGDITNELQTISKVGSTVTLSDGGGSFTDADTQLTDAQVATAVNNEFPNLDTDSTDDFDSEWSSLANVPAGFADDIDNDTQLTEAEVDAFVSNNGYLTSFSEVDGDITNE